MNERWRQLLRVAPLWLVFAAAAAVAAEEPEASACVMCHGSTDVFDDEDAALATDYLGSVHAEVGLSCHDCHGGNHDPELFEDMDAAMDADFTENPYRGAIARADIPAACGRCHSDPDYMRRFRPDARVDQEREYWTSRHGILLRDGDTNVATCVDCHGVHDIARTDDATAPVHPKNVAVTCSRCHSDAEHMAGYHLADGSPLPVDQYAKWSRSVHAAALLEREDLSAPTCNDCHGNHGAQPPGVDSVTYVCGQCHGREATLFRESGKRSLWEDHNELLADVGFGSCAACHEEPDPQAAITTMYHFGECTSCHGNHGIMRPTLAFFAPFESTPCAFCHETSGGLATNASMIGAGKSSYEATRDALVEEARQQGLSAEDQFNWLVDRSLQLAAHGAASEDGERSDAGERFERLFQKFRIGKTYYEYSLGDGSQPVRVQLQRCTWCHSEAPLLTDQSEGHRVGREMADQAIELMALTGQAERSLAAARRGGIELREAMLDVDRAVDAQIDLQVLGHRFRTDGEFAEAVAEGRGFAESAIRAGEEAQQELRFRRLGLLVFLGFVVCVAIGLGLKIRQI